MSEHIFPTLVSTTNIITVNDINRVIEMNHLIIFKLEASLRLSPTNFYALYLLFLSCQYGRCFFITNKSIQATEIRTFSLEFYEPKLFDLSFRLLHHPTVSGRYEHVRGECNHQLACLFGLYLNHPAALRFAKQAYEHCLRSSDHAQLAIRKAVYLESRDAFAKLPPLRFTVGDEVEFLHELETESEWKLGKIAELYYRERDFEITFNAPYRLQLLDDSVDQPPVYAWVKADIDRYVRKVGVRSIEDTRYQARLEVKVAKLAYVYCAKEFIQDIYSELAQDRGFVEMLQSVWGIELSVQIISLYRVLVMYREPLARTNTGYHVPSSEEVIADIKAYLDPAQAAGVSYLREIKAAIINMFRNSPFDSSVLSDDKVQGQLLHCIMTYIEALSDSIPPASDGLFRGTIDVPSEMSEAISRASTTSDLRLIYSVAMRQYDGDFCSSKVGNFLAAWIAVYKCLENPNVGPACECPWVYFFVKYCLAKGTGVPKLALALYDRMNMQLSKEFIRCANPTCELNRLDQSAGQVRFRLCSRCRAVIYCSRECQTAHYLEHRTLCREHSTGR